jgi:ABC-2 type transport system ATP-binding protein
MARREARIADEAGASMSSERGAPQLGGNAVDRSTRSGRADPGSPAAGSPGEAVLVVERLSKQFGERVAVSELSFRLAAGEVFGFLGPNGAGKTTTVRTLATLIEPTSGSAVVAGIPLRPENGVEIRQRISVMPESPGLYLRLTVEENLRFFAGL